MDEETIEPGDNVYVGNGRVHWIVAKIRGTTAYLNSGMTGRRFVTPLRTLRLHSKGRQ